MNESTGRWNTLSQDTNGHYLAGLAPGWYRVEVGAGPCGWHDLGRHFVADGAKVELGVFSPPPPGEVRLRLDPSRPVDAPQLALTFYLRRADIDIRGEPGKLAGSESLFLPAGEYWAFWTDAKGVIRHRALTVASGALCELDLAP